MSQGADAAPAPILGAITVQDVKAVGEQRGIAVNRHAAFPHGMDIVELQHNGQGKQLALRRGQAVGLFVVDPIAHVLDASVRQQCGVRGDSPYSGLNHPSGAFPVARVSAWRQQRAHSRVLLARTSCW